MSLQIHWTEQVSRTTSVKVSLTEEQLEDLREGYGTAHEFWSELVREQEGPVDIHYNEVDYIEIMEDVAEEPRPKPADYVAEHWPLP